MNTNDLDKRANRRKMPPPTQRHRNVRKDVRLRRRSFKKSEW